MRISCSTKWAAGGEPLGILRFIRDVGFGAVDLTGSVATAPSEEIDAALEETGLVLSGLTVESGEAEQWVTALKQAVDLEIGSLTLIAAGRKTQSLDDLANSLRVILASADRVGVGLELTNRLNSRLEQPSDFQELFVGPAAHEWGVVVDAVEFHRASVNPADAIAQLSDAMARLVVGDLAGGERVPLGNGEVSVAAVLGRARRAGYNDWLVLDPCVRPASVAADLENEYRRLLTLVENLGEV